MNRQLLENYKKSQEFFSALEKQGILTHNQKVRNSLEMYKLGYYTLEEAIKEATNV